MPTVHILNTYCRFCKLIVLFKVNADIPKGGDTDIRKPNGSWFIAAKQCLVEMRMQVIYRVKIDLKRKRK